MQWKLFLRKVVYVYDKRSHLKSKLLLLSWEIFRFWPKSHPQPLATRLQQILLVFSRSKWSIKIQRGNQCIMLFTWEWCDLLLLDTKKIANFCWVDVKFSTLINCFWELYEKFRGYFQRCINWNNHRKVLLEKKFD